MSGVGPPVLVEGFVVQSTCGYLAARGWRVTPVPTTASRGVDIVAVRGDQVLHVEAKGAGSSRPGTKRYGKSFDASQVHTCVAKASLAALEAASAGVMAAVAFPDLPAFRQRVARVAHSYRRLGIAVVWVAEDGTVDVENGALFGSS